jgi:NodT family efflux transporter outer membrane factor (OMF) lipoprotein
MYYRYLPVAAAAVFCCACNIGPRYQAPVAQIPVNFKEVAGNDQWKMATPSDALIKGKWWEMFNDPQLNALEEMVNINNFNVKQAEAQFRQARATVDLQHAGYYPVIGSSPSITQSDRGPNGSGGKGGGTSQTYSLPFTASWEPDLWGRVRLAVENATDNALVQAADLENIRLSTQATLAADYFQLMANDMQSALLTDSIGAYQKNLELTVNRFNGGVASKADVSLAQTQLASARAQQTDLRVARSQLEHAIAVLTGRPPAVVEIPVGRIPGPPPPIPLAVPSALLERRPDVSAGERLVMAANANVGIAQTAYYPTLTLSATAGFASTVENIAKLLTWGSRTWSAGPGVSETLFDFGRRAASLRGTEAAYDATVASYRQTVLAAFQEVEDDLAALRYLAEEQVTQAEAVSAAQQSYELELDRYKAGTDSYLNVITTQTIYLSDQQTAVTLLQRRMAAAVDLVKAMGGGWDNTQLPSADQLRTTAMADPKNTVNIAQPVGIKVTPVSATQ